MKTNFKNYFGIVAVILCAIFSQNSAAQCTYDDTARDAGQSGLKTFSTGYTFSFETVGPNDIKITFTLKADDVNAGGVGPAYLWKTAPGFQELGMTKSGLTFTTIYTVPDASATYSFAVKLPLPGGMIVTKSFTYKIGDCFTPPADSVNPVGFTATKGATTTYSVELFVNGTDDNNTVVYTATATPGGAVGNVTITGGGQGSLVVKGLNQNTDYTFSITAKDLSGNFALNSPITGVAAKTLVDTSTPCAGTSAIADQGTFSTGYDYSFTTAGNDVAVHFKLNDTDKTGVMAYVFKTNADDTNFSESGMGGVTDVTKTFSGLTVGDSYKFAIKFAYAGGMVVSKYFTYKVGDACAALGIEDAELAANDIKVYPNPVKGGTVNVEAGTLSVSKVEVYSILGAKVLETSKTAFSTANLQAGIYFVKIYAEGKSITKKLVVN